MIPARQHPTPAAGLVAMPGVTVLPSPPQVNMFHLDIAAAATALNGARDRAPAA